MFREGKGPQARARELNFSFCNSLVREITRARERERNGPKDYAPSIRKHFTAVEIVYLVKYKLLSNVSYTIYFRIKFTFESIASRNVTREL